ncbi:MAG: hypothetical protein KTR16_09455 [Acidiferrobacterales bacterium]|nr:hypothetical protein [Acidiferrobacterales bacterium]
MKVKDIRRLQIWISAILALVILGGRTSNPITETSIELTTRAIRTNLWFVTIWMCVDIRITSLCENKLKLPNT